MIQQLKRIPQWLFNRLGYQVTRLKYYQQFPSDIDSEAQQMIQAVSPYTMSSLECMFALIQGVRYLVRNDIPGDIVECGVWRGGSMMLVALELCRLQQHQRNLYLFDTFQGMPAPSVHDISYSHTIAAAKFDRLKSSDDGSDWCYASLDDVRQAMSTTKYPAERIHFVQGKVEETIPIHAPDRIALLRLDTDWYESTKHELEHLYPRLVPGGVLLIDDYGHWQGCQKAVDEYFANQHLHPLLHRIDYTGRIMIKAGLNL